MRILLDTHIFLWYISGDKRLSDKIKNEVQDATNEVYLSTVSLWEIIVKYQLGKLPLPHPPEIYIAEQREKHLIASLSLDEQSVAQLANLPSIHRDPFDRMLICQALEHNLTIATMDKDITTYSISIIS